MRYLIQGIVMISDPMIIIVTAFVIYTAPKSVFTWILVFFVFSAWQSQGGFMAWDPRTIKKFLKRAKEIGL